MPGQAVLRIDINLRTVTAQLYTRDISNLGYVNYVHRIQGVSCLTALIYSEAQAPVKISHADKFAYLLARVLVTQRDDRRSI